MTAAATVGVVEVESCAVSNRRPITFDGCFGWFHPGPRRRGVVLCAAFGIDGLSAHRAWGELAEALAAAGLPTLRFDWAGTGDSLGDDRDPDRLAAWRASLSAAIDRLKSETSVDEIALVGLRLGATLAAEVAATRDDVTHLIAAAPVVSGRAYVREQQSLARFLRVRGEDEPADTDEIGGFAVAGYFTADATAADLKAIDLRRLAAAPARRVLLLARPGDTVTAELATTWRAAGASVEEAPFPEVDALIENPTKSRLPTAAWSLVVATLTRGLDEAVSVSPGSASAPRVGTSPRLETAEWIEEPLLFGPEERLFGVLTTPRRPRAGAPSVILLDAGRIPHVGWGRGAVETARLLAGEGRRVLRMDPSSIGDSLADPNGPAEVLYTPETVTDVVAAMDRLATPGDDRFVVVGTCSGAYLALHTALDDARVAGLVMVNLQRFIWTEGESLEVAMRTQLPATNVFAERMFRADTWRRLLAGRIDVVSIARVLARRLVTRAVAAVRRTLVVDPVVKWLQMLDRRGSRILFVFGTYDGGRDEFAAHVGAEARLPRTVPGARLRLIERTDHNIGPRDSRATLHGYLREFLETVDAKS